ncbi:MAG: FmdB family zinc ribbon protein [Thermoleophilaceae bacterium]|jgi:putative FmdB family regulatory protein
MPIYEYVCENEHVFDVMQRMSDESLTSCTQCGASVRRVLFAPAVHFKGSGFYSTDYGKAKSGGGSGEGSSESSPGEGSSKNGGGDSSSGEKSGASKDTSSSSSGESGSSSSSSSSGSSSSE